MATHSLGTSPMSLGYGTRVLFHYRICDSLATQRVLTFVTTFCAYTCFHLTRKPFSVVKGVLHQSGENATGWYPFTGDYYREAYAILEYAFLLTYAFSMFCWGYVSERSSPRQFLCTGMVLSGLACFLWSCAYWFDVHSLWYFIFIQIISGVVQAMGFSVCVKCVSSWLGPNRRGLLMCLWNASTSLGNIFGSYIAGFWVKDVWAWSFAVPGIIIIIVGFVVWLFLVPNPSYVQFLKEPDVIESLIDPTEDGDEIKYEKKAINWMMAFTAPGVIDFSLCILFNKAVSYALLYWLPLYLLQTNANIGAEASADISAFFDIGAIIGSIIAGIISDQVSSRSSVMFILLFVSAPLLVVYERLGAISITYHSIFLFVLGMFINSPFSLLSTAVAMDLSSQPVLREFNSISTMASIMDGFGSIGATIGPPLSGVLSSNWTNVYIFLAAFEMCAALALLRPLLHYYKTAR